MVAEFDCGYHGQNLCFGGRIVVDKLCNCARANPLCATARSWDIRGSRRYKHHQNSTREKNENCGGRGTKSAKFWASRPSGPALRDPTLRGPTIRGPTLRGPTLRDPTLRDPTLLGLSLHPSGPHPLWSKNSTSKNWPKLILAEVDVGRSRNWPKSKLAEVEIGRSRKKSWQKSKLAEVDRAHKNDPKCKHGVRF